MMPMMVEENIMAAPTTNASKRLKPNSRATPAPISRNRAEDTTATKVDFLRVINRAWGCMSRPSRNSKKMMPTWAISASSLTSVTRLNPCGPIAAPSTI